MLAEPPGSSNSAELTMSDGFREVTLDDPEQGEVKLLIATPRGDDPWGRLAPLRGTTWGDQVAVVSFDAMDQALRDWATPLMREIGVAPSVRARRIPDETGVCTLTKTCIGAKPHCRPGSEVPDCYEPPEVGLLGTRLALAWREGRYVVVVT